MLTAIRSVVKETAFSELREQGITCVSGVFSKTECRNYISNLEGLLEERMRQGEFVGNERYQVIYNYFLGQPDMFGLMYQDATDTVMTEMIDQDYVLISPSARNRQIRTNMMRSRPTSGVGWHTDSRFIGKAPQMLRPTPIYFSAVALDDLSKDNGATFYIPGSHQWYRRPDNRNAELESLVLEAEAGSVVYFDSALWHRVGDPGVRSRWVIFNMFGPWFMKPYFRFHEMFSDDEMEAFSPKVRQLLHCDSIPPKDHRESTITLRRVRAQAAAAAAE